MLKNVLPFQFQQKKNLEELVKMEKKLQKNISYRLKLIDSARFIASLLSNLLNNFAEGIHKSKCKY